MDKPNLFQKFYSAINAVRHKISQQDGIQYKKVASIDMKSIDFATVPFQYHPLDGAKRQTIIPVQID